MLRHPEGFLRVLLENKRVVERPYLRQVVKQVLERSGKEPNVISVGLRALARQTETDLGRELAKTKVSPELTKTATTYRVVPEEAVTSIFPAIACHQPDGKGLAGVFPPLAGSNVCSVSPRFRSRSC